MNEPQPSDEEIPAEIRGGDRPSDYVPDVTQLFEWPVHRQDRDGVSESEDLSDDEGDVPFENRPGSW